MLRPSNPPREITIDLPELLVTSLGLGAEILAHYLTSLAESGASDPEHHPPPLPVLCRICERQITPWWFEKHSEGCTQEYRAEEAVTLAQDALVAHRPAIVKVLDALDPEQRQSRSVPGEGVGPLPSPEYKGLSIGSSQGSSGTDSGRASPAIRSRSRDPSVGSLGHARGKSFTVRRPLYRVAELIIDLCDTAIAINTPAIKENKAYGDANGGEFRSQSPHSESLISQIMQWSSPNSSTLEQEPGLAALTTDTENLAQAKVEAVLRHREIIEYSERIRIEFNSLVIDCIEAAIQKAKKIKEGQLSDSSEEEEEEDATEEEAQTPAAQEMAFPMGGYDGPSAMATALRNVSDPSLASQYDRRQSSVTTSSTRSSSPMECATPRSHANSISMLGRTDSVNKRHSILLGSDAGDSDTNMSQSMYVGGRRTQSPNADLALARSTSSAERKRRSLRLPNLPSPSRQSSPARMQPPSSPLRIPKPRLPHGLESLPSLASPVTSPPLSGTEMASPVVTTQRHRRQSSAASSAADIQKQPSSPRLAGISQPQARAVPTSIKDFEIIKPISKGAFGSVYLSKKKSTGDYFAIKVLRKADMIAKNQVTNVKAERAIMMWQGESDFVAKLYWTFSSKDYLFLVMEYLNGGDCAALVKVLSGLPEDWAKKYMAEVVLGIEHLHSRGIVHRDLKPDNLLIDQRGHLKLTDFGLSRMGLIGRQKRALKSPHDSTPDLLKFGPFARNTSIASSRSASFDMQGGNHSPQSTPVMTPDLAGSQGQPSYFTLNRDTVLGREHSRRKSGYRSDSGNSDSFNMMFRNFSLNEDTPNRGARIEEETYSEGDGSPDLYALRPTTSNASNGRPDTPPHSNMLPPPMALFDPQDQNRRFVGTPDYLAPETINGFGQDEMSDWWSLGCILFEFLFGYPPFHADTPEKVFENILARKIDWADEVEVNAVSDEAKDLMVKLMTIEPKERLGSNMADKYASGGEEVRQHPFFEGTKWETLLEDEAQFIPAPSNPEDTEYFDARGATLQSFAEEMEDQASSPAGTPGAEYQERPHDALSRVRSQVNSSSLKRGLMPLHIPAHVRDGRSRRLSEPVASDDFGNFAFKNLPVLQKANNDVLQKLLESTQRSTKGGPSSQSPGPNSASPSLEGSPLIPMPLKRARSANKGKNRPASPSNLGHANESPSRPSNPSSPLLVSFSTGQNHERRKTSSTCSTLSHQSSASLQPGQFFEPPRLPAGFSATSAASNTSSPIKSNRNSMIMPMTSPEKTQIMPRPHSIHASSRARSQTVGSQEETIPPSKPFHNKRQSQVFDISPSSSDNEDPRAKALLRVQRRRQSSRRMSQIMLADGPAFRALDVLVCEDHPVSRMVMERLLEKLRCRTISVTNGSEAARYAMSEVQFDIIMMEFKLPQINGADVARMIRDTKSANTQTPIICVTGYLKELPQTHHFDSLIEKPATPEKLTEALCNLCAWKPPPPGYDPQKQQTQEQQKIIPSGLRQESRHVEDSPSSQSSGPFTHTHGLYKQSSREHSIGSSLFGDTDSTNTEDIPVIVGRPSDEWVSVKGLGISEDMSPPSTTFIHPGLPHLIHQNSAPPALDLRTPRKQRSVEAVKAKRENLEKKRHECAESGDDEDEELGKLPSRARSPQGKPRGSRLSIEMMRTNSRGSVTSGGDEPAAPGMTSNPDVEMTGVDRYHATIVPPELFPKESKGDAVEVVDMDATPKPSAAAANAAIENSSLPKASRPLPILNFNPRPGR